MKIYGMRTSTCTRKVMLTLHEKESDFEFIPINLAKGEHKQPEHLARHPFGVIPVLDDDGYLLYESRAIIRYLDKRLAGTSLTPSDAAHYGRMEQWLSVEASFFSPHALTIIKQMLWHMQPADAEALATAAAKVAHACDVINQALAQQPYLGGEHFSLADISWMPYVDCLLATPISHLITEREHVNAWWQRVSARPAWQKIITKP